jgi:tRNA(Ile)-lysidine synthase
MHTDELLRELRIFVDTNLPAMRCARCVLAVSGGADSAAMVGLLVQSGIIDHAGCALVHFDHRMRGPAAARRDREVVDALGARYRLPVIARAWDAPRPGEAAARDARYAAMADVARLFGAHGVVTGHTADDQAETVLMRAMRGCGLHGLAGMSCDALYPAEPTLRLWRPLLAQTRAGTRGYCASSGLDFEDDETNNDRTNTRNRVRLDVLPALERRSPAIRATLLALGAQARAAAIAVEAEAIAFLDGAQSLGEDGVALSRKRLGAASPGLLPNVLRLAVTRLLGDPRDLDRRHYALFAHALRAETGSTFMLPRGLVLTCDADALILSSGALPAPGIDAAAAHELPFEGMLGAWRLRVVPAGEASLADGGSDLRLPEGAVLRGRRPGDRLRTRAGGKKLGDWYTDRKIPRRERESAPVIAYGQQVCWTPWGALGELPHGRAWRITSHRAS